MKRVITFLLFVLHYVVVGYCCNGCIITCNDSCVTISDSVYNGKAIHFEEKTNLTTAYVEELCNNFRPDEELAPDEYRYAVERYLQDEEVIATFDEIKDIAVKYFIDKVNFEKRGLTIVVHIDECGKIICLRLIYSNRVYKTILAKDVYDISYRIVKNITFKPLYEYRLKTVQIYIPIINK